MKKRDNFRYYGVEADGKWTENFKNLIESMVTDAGDSNSRLAKFIRSI